LDEEDYHDISDTIKSSLSLLMKYFVLSLTLILSVHAEVLAQAVNSFPSNLSNLSLDGMITSILDDTYDCKFVEALSKTDKLIAAFPGNPEGYLYKSGIYWKMLEEGCVESKDSTKAEIRLLIDKACELSRRELDAHPNDIMAHFDCAGSLAYRAGSEAINHDWLAVMSDGIKAKEMLEKTIEIDPNFYDAYSGIGAFNYYAAHVPWYLKPLAFVIGLRGNEDEGIAQLKKAAQFGKHAKIEAAVFLATVVYVNKQDYTEGAKLLLELHRQFPDNLDFLRDLCHDYYEMENFTEAIRCADAALSTDDPVGLCYRKSISYIRFYRGKSYEKLNKKDSAIADYEMVVKLDGDDYSGREAKAALEKLRGQ
jgi:tetratricopeptide (TPR) repeat protein